MPGQRQVFSEQQVAEIMQRAVQLHEESQGAASYTPGVTAEELERMAEEVGVDARFLRQAIEEASQPRPVSDRTLNFVEEFHRVVEGELDPQNFDVLQDVYRPMQTRYGAGGVQIGRSFRSQAWTGWGAAEVNVSSRNGRTKINVRSGPFIAYFAGLHGPLILGIVGASILLGNGLIWPGIAVGVGLVGAGVAAFRWLLRKGHDAARSLADRLADRVEEEVGQPGGGD